MRIADIMTMNCKYCAADDTVASVAKAMDEAGVGAMPVAREDKLIGFLTDRDIVTRCIAPGKDPASTKACDIMSDQVLYCFDHQNTDFVAKNMAKNQVRRLPVVDREKRLVGMVTLGDLATNGPKAQAATALQGVANVAA